MVNKIIDLTKQGFAIIINQSVLTNGLEIRLRKHYDDYSNPVTSAQIIQYKDLVNYDNPEKLICEVLEELKNKDDNF